MRLLVLLLMLVMGLLAPHVGGEGGIPSRRVLAPRGLLAVIQHYHLVLAVLLPSVTKPVPPSLLVLIVVVLVVVVVVVLRLDAVATLVGQQTRRHDHGGATTRGGR
jgi:fatty acid desaturase